MNVRHKWLCALTLFALTVLSFARCSPSKAAPDAGPQALNPPPAKPEPAVVENGRGFVGIIVPNQVADLVARVDGRIDAVHYRVGDPVKEGAIVVALNVKAVGHDLAKAEAQLRLSHSEQAKAKVDLAQALESLERQRRLTQFISEEDLKSAEYKAQLAQTQIASAAARVSQDQASVNQLRDVISEAQIRTPFDGVLGERFYDPGVWVKQNTPLVRVIGSGEPRVRFAVPEEDAAMVAIDRPVLVDLGRKEKVPGRVSHLSAEIDIASGTLTAEATLDSRDRKVSAVPGSVARVFVQLSDARVQNFQP